MATIEHATETGTYRSEDGGETWRRMSRTNPRPMYYSAIYIDPTYDRRVYILWNGVMKSEDGGATFRAMPGQPTYDVGLKTDHHAMWIDPTDTRHLYLVGDGGMFESWDMAESWIRMNDIPVGQFYAIGADNRDPYWVYGGMQDNHSWMGPSATRHWLGIVNTDWKQIGFSDGVYEQPDPFNPRWVYSNSDMQNIQRVDIETGDRLDIKPTPGARRLGVSLRLGRADPRVAPDPGARLCGRQPALHLARPRSLVDGDEGPHPERQPRHAQHHGCERDGGHAVEERRRVDLQRDHHHRRVAARRAHRVGRDR